MKFIEKSGDILNTLIKVNMDRVAGFEHASNELDEKDIDLEAIFRENREESLNNIKELKIEIDHIERQTGTTISISDVIKKAWLDVKATFLGHDRKSILIACERSEYAVKRAYSNILSKKNNLSTALKDKLSTQEIGIFIAHDNILCLCDTAA